MRKRLICEQCNQVWYTDGAPGTITCHCGHKMRVGKIVIKPVLSVLDVDGSSHEYDKDVHHVEARGGRWYVMDKEEKLYRVTRETAKELQ